MSHLRECGSQAPFPGGFQMIREVTQVWCESLISISKAGNSMTVV